MDELYLSLYEGIKPYISHQDTLDLIEKAYLFARNAHNGQKRASGEDYITHPVAVAVTLCQYQADPITIISALLHDVIEDTKATYDDIKKEFGIEVANLVEGLTKIEKISYTESERGNLEYASNFQKMLFSMSKDIRVIWVKLSDRLNNMQTLNYLPYEKQIRISNETLAIYAPIAHKLGMYKIKAELEDLSFKYLYSEDYYDISKKIKYSKKSREKDINRMMDELRILLKDENIPSDISGRAKNIYSIYNKMHNKGTPFENIYDLQALRIIVDSVMDCYKTIGIVHSKYTPVPSRFKDYIAMPKPNMYQSLHTTVISDGKIYEIQIRTKEMDEIAEYGIAAHWAYKEGVKVKKNFYESTAQQLRWYSDLIKYTNEKGETEKSEVTTIFSEDVLHANVYVFTPKNTVIALPEGSTPIDFAYRIHTRVGETFTGAIVNGKMVPMDYQFRTGDICEIKTSSNAFGPNDNWLKIAKTSGARNKIKQFLSKKNRDLLIEQGTQMLENDLKAKKLNFDITDKNVEEKFGAKQIHNLEELHIAIAKNVISTQAVINAYTVDDRKDSEKLIDMINERNKNRIYHEDIDIIVEGLDTPSVKIAQCCRPIPGDEIVGYVTKGIGIGVHRKNCKNFKSFDENRIIPVYWAPTIDRRFQVDLKLIVGNRDNILADLINTAIYNNGKVVKVSARTNSIDEGVINLTLMVLNKAELDTIIANMEKVKGVYSIERVRK